MIRDSERSITSTCIENLKLCLSTYVKILLSEYHHLLYHLSLRFYGLRERVKLGWYGALSTDVQFTAWGAGDVETLFTEDFVYGKKTCELVFSSELGFRPGVWTRKWLPTEVVDPRGSVTEALEKCDEKTCGDHGPAAISMLPQEFYWLGLSCCCVLDAGEGRCFFRCLDACCMGSEDEFYPTF
jgi:hypothetical protein